MTVSRAGHRVAAMRRRRSTSCSCGTLTRNGRIAPFSVAASAAVANRLEAPAAAALARKPRRLSDDDVADMIVLPVGNGTCGGATGAAAWFTSVDAANGTPLGPPR